jgi:hypothetical protein
MASTYLFVSGLAGLIDMTLSKAHGFAHRLRPTRVHGLLRNRVKPPERKESILL